jgi:hypothetical protein
MIGCRSWPSKLWYHVMVMEYNHFRGPPKRQYPTTLLHSVSIQKTITWITVKTLTLTIMRCFVENSHTDMSFEEIMYFWPLITQIIIVFAVNNIFNFHCLQLHCPILIWPRTWSMWICNWKIYFILKVNCSDNVSLISMRA